MKWMQLRYFLKDLGWCALASLLPFFIFLLYPPFLIVQTIAFFFFVGICSELMPALSTFLGSWLIAIYLGAFYMFYFLKVCSEMFSVDRRCQLVNPA